MIRQIPPHGGELLPLMARDEIQADLQKKAGTLYRIVLSSKEVSDLIMLATGAFSPLDGFMDRADYQRVVSDMRLAKGLLWPIPVTLPVEEEIARAIKTGDEVSLYDPDSDAVIALMRVENKYEYDRHEEALCVYGTHDPQHPGVKKILQQGGVNLAGPVTCLSEGEYPEAFPEYARPRETRRIFAERGWKTVAAFQTRNPIHRSHEYLTKIALEVCDGLFIHPVVGSLKEGDIPARVRMKCYRALLDTYYPPGRVVLKVYPMEMRYAGPREALLHGIIRQNFGCTHLIVGRDHAGVGSYYGPFDAQDIFDTLGPGDLQIQPLKFDWTFWCERCQSMASPKTCPHDQSSRLMIAGTRLREMLCRGEKLPQHFTRPEVAEILMDYYSKNEYCKEEE